MTPREVDELTDEEYAAFVRFLERDAREQKRAVAKARRR